MDTHVERRPENKHGLYNNVFVLLICVSIIIIIILFLFFVLFRNRCNTQKINIHSVSFGVANWTAENKILPFASPARSYIPIYKYKYIGSLKKKTRVVLYNLIVSYSSLFVRVFYPARGDGIKKRKIQKIK